MSLQSLKRNGLIKESIIAIEVGKEGTLEWGNWIEQKFAKLCQMGTCYYMRENPLKNFIPALGNKKCFTL